jgi:peptide deformylase
MIANRLLPPDDPILRVKASFVESAREAVEIIHELEQVLLTLNNCLGIAASQIGIPRAVSIIRGFGNSIDLINPTLISGEGEVVSMGEGCMSFPGRRFDVPRFRLFRIENFGIWPNGADSQPLGDNVSNPYHSSYGMRDLPADARLVATTIVFNHSQAAEHMGGLVAIAAQHEYDHICGITLPSKEGAKEVVAVPTGQIQAKVGRNDPCPCGRRDESGKPMKFKKCCGK